MKNIYKAIKIRGFHKTRDKINLNQRSIYVEHVTS